MTARMLTAVTAAVLGLVVLIVTEAEQHVWAKEPITLHGSIKSFECGDNCYLTILTEKGAEVVGLCVAKECTPWNENAQIPKNLIGKKVVVTVGVGGVFDAEGNLRDEMRSFTSVHIEQ